MLMCNMDQLSLLDMCGIFIRQEKMAVNHNPNDIREFGKATTLKELIPKGKMNRAFLIENFVYTYFNFVNSVHNIIIFRYA